MSSCKSNKFSLLQQNICSVCHGNAGVPNLPPKGSLGCINRLSGGSLFYPHNSLSRLKLANMIYIGLYTCSVRTGPLSLFARLHPAARDLL